MNPFLQLQAEPKHEPSSPPNADGILFYDLETLPDERRFIRPVSDPSSSSMPDLDPEAFLRVNTTVEAINKQLDSRPLSAAQYAAVIAVEQRRDKPRATVIGSCQKRADAIGGELTAWVKEHSVNPFKARICAFGWAVGNGEIHSMLAKTDEEEIAIIRQWYELAAPPRRRCGYNISGFDELLVGIRAIILGIDPPFKISRKKYGNASVIDIMTLMFPSGGSMKCKDVATCFEIVTPADGVDGSQVFSLYEAGKFDEIETYVRSDVEIEREMYFRWLEAFCE